MAEKKQQWKCKVCGYTTDKKIDVCPECGKDWSYFEKI